MWTLFLLLSTVPGASFALPVAGHVEEVPASLSAPPTVPLVGSAVAVGLPTASGRGGRTLDDGDARWAGDTWLQRTVRRRRVSRTVRLRVDPRPPRHVRTAEREARRVSATAAAIRIRRASAVARAVAHAARRAHAPSRLGPSETYPPAA